MERPRHFEDTSSAKPRTHGRTITETDFVVHAGHTGDFFPHHMDAEFMKSSPIRPAHRARHDDLRHRHRAHRREINPLAFTYGYERLRFPKPVFIGDTIHTVLTIAALEADPKRPHYGRVIEQVRVINQRGETVLACDHVYSPGAGAE